MMGLQIWVKLTGRGHDLGYWRPDREWARPYDDGPSQKYFQWLDGANHNNVKIGVLS